MHPEPLIGRAANHAFNGLRVIRGGHERFFIGSALKQSRIQRLFHEHTVAIPIAYQNKGPDKGLGPDGEDSGPLVDGGLLAKERQEKRFAPAGIVIREERRVSVLSEYPQYRKSRFPVSDDARPVRGAQPT